MGTSIQGPTGIPQVTSTQLKAGDSSSINSAIRLLAQQIQRVQGNSGDSKISGNLTAGSVTLTNQGVGRLPAPNQALTLEVANSLFSLAAIKQASATNTFEGQPSPGIAGGSGQSGLVIEDTNAHRIANYPASASPVGSIYYETDRMVFYLNETVGQKQQWVYILGQMSGTVVSVDQRPLLLGASDQGFLFTATDLGITYQWQWNSGSMTGAWVPIVTAAVALQGSHSALTSHPAADYAVGTVFLQTDRFVVYEVQVVSSANAWVYVLGSMTGTTISVDQRPTGLGANDTGFLFNSSDGLVVYRWSGSAWLLISGIAQGVDSAKPATLGAGDAGFPYFSTDKSTLYVWSGTAWGQVGSGSGSSGWGSAAVTTTLTTTPASAGAVVSLTKSGTWLFVAVAEMNVIGSGDVGVKLQIALTVYTASALYIQGADGTSGVATISAVVGGIAASVGSPLSIGVTVSKSGGTGSSTCTYSSLSAVWVSNP
jgi:hypothetical protein